MNSKTLQTSSLTIAARNRTEEYKLCPSIAMQRRLPDFIKLEALLRLLALATLVVATPLTILKLPWLPVTLEIFVETVSKSTVSGTPGYIKEHSEWAWRLTAALALYAVGLAAIVGLAGVVIGICRNPTTQATVWLCCLLVGISLPIFDASGIGPTTNRGYIFAVIYLPIGVAVLSAVALIGVLFLRRKS